MRVAAIPVSASASSAATVRASQRNTRLIRTASAVLSVQGITWLASLIEIVIVPRSLGSSNYGLMSTSFQVSQILVLFAMFGTSNFIVREVARNPNEGKRIVFAALTLRLALWAVIGAASLLVLPLVTDTLTARLVFSIVMAAATMQLVTEAGYSGLQGNQSLGAAALAGAVVGISTQFVLATVLLLGGGVVTAAVVGASGAGVSAVVIALLVFRYLLGPIKTGVRSALETASGSVSFLAWDLGRKVYAASGLLMVAALTDSASAGHFAFAYRIFGIPGFVATAIAAALYPALSAAFRTDPEWYRSAITQSARVVVIATVPMAIGLGVLAPEITSLLSGGEFGDSSVPLAVLALAIPLIAVHTVIGVGLFATDRHRLMGAVAWVAAAATVGLNLLAIPWTKQVFGNGAIGAAMVVLATELIVGVVLWRVMWPELQQRRFVSTVTRVLLAGAIMAIVVYVAAISGGLALAIPAGAVCYIGTSLAIQTFTIVEARELVNGLRMGSDGRND